MTTKASTEETPYAREQRTLATLERETKILDGELAKLRDAQAAQTKAKSIAREIFRTEGPNGGNYTKALAAARVAGDRVAELETSVAFATETRDEAAEQHRVASREAEIARARDQHGAAFVDLFKAKVDEKLVPRVLAAYQVLAEVLADARALVDDNARAFMALKSREQPGMQSMIPGEMRYERLSLAKVLEQVQDEITRARGTVDTACMLPGANGRPWASEVHELVIDGVDRSRPMDGDFVKQHTLRPFTPAHSPPAPSASTVDAKGLA
jgi:hypothetical protein